MPHGEQWVKLKAGQLRAAIDPRGAQLMALDHCEVGPLLSDGDPAFWTGHAPILFPVIGCLVGGQYRLGDASFPMPKHGFARHSVFDVVSAGSVQADLALESSPETVAIFPFDFELRITFALSGDALFVNATVANRGESTMPVSFGFHPAFRWPLPFGGARDEHVLEFDRSEPAPIRRIDSGGLLLAQTEASPVMDRVLHPTDELFANDALIFDALESRRVTYGVRGRTRLAVEYVDFPVLGLWTRPGAPFLCIEPWHGLPDPVGFAGDILDKPGIVAIPPASQKEMTMRISLVPS